MQSAVASTGRPAEVRITASLDEAAAVIEVADTGPGVPPAARSKLFEAFFTSSRAGGSGLGLVIAADLVRAHGGSIMLVAKDEDERPGARFRVTLPLREANGGA
jgi:signal transduction histidine kinase